MLHSEQEALETSRISSSIPFCVNKKDNYWTLRDNTGIKVVADPGLIPCTEFGLLSAAISDTKQNLDTAGNNPSHTHQCQLYSTNVS